MTKEEVRLSVPIPIDLHNKLEALIPRGLKASTVRTLLELLIQAQIDDPSGEHIVMAIVHGKCKLTRSNFEQETTV